MSTAKQGRKWSEIVKQAIEHGLLGADDNPWNGAWPPGKILHKGIPDYNTVYGCERYLVINQKLWLELDDEGDILGSGVPDLYGRVHWEDRCPNKH